MKTADALAQLADALTAAGVPCALDPRDVQLPGAWLKRNGLTPDLLCGGMTMRVRVMLISPDVGTLDALRFLDDLYALAHLVMPSNVPTPATDTTALLPDSATPYPATYFDVDVELTD